MERMCLKYRLLALLLLVSLHGMCVPMDTTRHSGTWAIGIQAGLSLNYLLTNIANRDNELYDPRAGFCGGIPVSYRRQIGRHSALGIGIAPSFVQKSYSLDRNDQYNMLYQRTRNDYFQVPLALSYYYALRRSTLFLCGGGYGAYWLDGRIKGAVPNMINTSAPSPQAYSYDESYAFNSVRDQRQEWGWQAGGGVESSIGGRYRVVARLDVYQSLTDQQKDYMIGLIPRYNRTFALSIGILKTR
jgi:Outer membrane protein beta-barrel domain